MRGWITNKYCRRIASLPSKGAAHLRQPYHRERLFTERVSLSIPGGIKQYKTMSVNSKLTILVAIIDIVFGILLSPLSREYPLFHWIAKFDVALIGLLPSLTPPEWGYTFEMLQEVDLRGQNALITGGNSGIGFEIAKALSSRGAAVTLACRSPQRCFAAADMIRKAKDYSGAPIHPLIMDVSDLR